MTTPPALATAQRERVLVTWSLQTNAPPFELLEATQAKFRTREHGWLWDLESQVYNVNAGHGHPHIRARMHAQIDAVAAANPNAVLPIREELGRLVCTQAGFAKAFFPTGGSEAVENAIKMARLYTGKTKVITRQNSYHGATLAVLEVAGDRRKQAFTATMKPGLHIADPYPWTMSEGRSDWVASLEEVVAQAGPDTVAAILLEGFTGTNGMQLPPPDFWPRVRELCTAHNIVLIDDEIFSGFGRTGRWFAVEHWGVKPDMMVIGKGMTSGYAALSGVLVSQKIATHFDSHKLWCGLTHYAHPVSCAAAVGAFEVTQREGLVANAEQVGSQFLKALQQLASAPELGIVDVRGLGLMIRVELNRNTAQLHSLMLERGVFLPVRDNAFFVCPPLCLPATAIPEIVSALADGLSALPR
ncbi:MAG: aspartate aminotransferase family protein [Nannocystaceae bacterium]